MNPDARTPRYVIELAGKLRTGMTSSERKLWNRIRNRQLGGYRFRRQHPVNRYILDFYCPEVRLAIEVDGGVHELREDYDEYRDTVLRTLRIETFRIKDSEIENSIDTILLQILDRLKALDAGKASL